MTHGFDLHKRNGVFTSVKIMEEKKPILLAVHELEDGAWQFLSGEELDVKDLCMAPLEEVIRIDPSLKELGDLPLAWEAARENGDAPWKRSPMFPTDFEKLTHGAYAYLNPQQEATTKEFDLDYWERFKYDRECASLEFLNADKKPEVEADIQIVGTYAKNKRIWRWSWADQYVEEQLKGDLLLFEDFGKQNSFKKMIAPQMRAEEVDAWEMTVIASYLLNAKGVFKAPGKDGVLYMIFRDIRRVSQTP